MFNGCSQCDVFTILFQICFFSNPGKVLENVKVSSVLNRAVRTVANLAQDEQCCKEIHETEGLLENIVKLLKDADDPECQQTYLRAIRYIGCSIW